MHVGLSFNFGVEETKNVKIGKNENAKLVSLLFFVSRRKFVCSVYYFDRKLSYIIKKGKMKLITLSSSLAG